MCFDANDKDSRIKRIEKAERTHLTEFFELNENDAFARTLLYLPRHPPGVHMASQGAALEKEGVRCPK